MTVLGHRSSTATSGSTTVGGVAGHGASLPEITSDDAFAVHRTDHLGLPFDGRRAVLTERLPYGTNLYGGFFTVMPNRLGAGGTQLEITRVPISRWVNGTRGISASRTNATSMTWGALTVAAVIVGWGLWTEVTGGTLRAFDFLRNEADEPVTRELAIGVRPGIPAGRIGLVL